MDPLVQWLASTFGTEAPGVAAGMGLAPPGPMPGPMSFANPGAPQQSPDFQPAPQGGSVWDHTSAPQAAAAPQAGGNQLASALRGMAAPQVPAAQKVGTPSAPRMNDIKGGELLALLLAQQENGVPGGRKVNPLPGTLGQALNAPRY